MPRVSVVTAVYNGEPFVGEAIESLLRQSFDDFELLVVDDGSTDRTTDVVRSYDDGRIRLVENGRNLGLAPSLNRGLALARGEFIARQDADDRSVPDRLARQIAYMDAHPDVALVGSWYTEIGPDGAPLRQGVLPATHADLVWHLCLYCPFVHSAVLWRREFVAERVGNYDERLSYSMDYDLWRRIALRGRVANVAAPLVDLRTHAASMTSTYDDRSYDDRSREGVRMRAAHAARLLGWPAHDVPGNVARLERLYAVLFSTPRTPAASEVRSDAAEVERLHEAVVRTGAVSARDARAQRRWLRRRLAQQMVRVARSAAANGHAGDAWELLRAATQWAPRALLSRAAAGACLALVAPSRG